MAVDLHAAIGSALLHRDSHPAILRFCATHREGQTPEKLRKELSMPNIAPTSPGHRWGCRAGPWHGAFAAIAVLANGTGSVSHLSHGIWID